jgi:hypothetical protein
MIWFVEMQYHFIKNFTFIAPISSSAIFLYRVQVSGATKSSPPPDGNPRQQPDNTRWRPPPSQLSPANIGLKAANGGLKAANFQLVDRQSALTRSNFQLEDGNDRLAGDNFQLVPGNLSLHSANVEKSVRNVNKHGGNGKERHVNETGRVGYEAKAICRGTMDVGNVVARMRNRSSAGYLSR